MDITGIDEPGSVPADRPEAPDASPAPGDTGSPAPRCAPGFVEHFVGVVRAGPGSGSGGDYTDARYYVDRAVPRQGLRPDDRMAADADALPGVKECVTATNLAELAEGTHTLPAGTLVQVFTLYTRGTPAAKLRVFNLPPRPPAVVVRISGAAGGAGKYDGRILTGTSGASPSTDLGMPAGLGAPGADDALVLNAEEDGLTGHRLAGGSYVVGIVKGMTTETPPRRVVVARGGVGAGDSPATVGSTSEGSESSDTTRWSRPADGSPVGVYVVSRVVYNEAGDRTIYAFVRQLTFDARGLLSAVSGETRVTVDVTESCP